MADHNRVGHWGETVAREYLIAKGYVVLDQNCRSGNLEIDLIAMHHDRLIFIEVKARSADPNPELAVDKRRRARMIRAADNYIARYDLPHQVQYDIIAISGNEHDYEITHFEDAFFAPLGLRR